jgi:hypothetical protein
MTVGPELANHRSQAAVGTHKRAVVSLCGAGARVQGKGTIVQPLTLTAMKTLQCPAASRIGHTGVA